MDYGAIQQKSSWPVLVTAQLGDLRHLSRGPFLAKPATATKLLSTEHDAVLRCNASLISYVQSHLNWSEIPTWSHENQWSHSSKSLNMYISYNKENNNNHHIPFYYMPLRTRWYNPTSELNNRAFWLWLDFSKPNRHFLVNWILPGRIGLGHEEKSYIVCDVLWRSKQHEKKSRQKQKQKHPGNWHRNHHFFMVVSNWMITSIFNLVL